MAKQKHTHTHKHTHLQPHGVPRARLILHTPVPHSKLREGGLQGELQGNGNSKFLGLLVCWVWERQRAQSSCEVQVLRERLPGNWSVQAPSSGLISCSVGSHLPPRSINMMSGIFRDLPLPTSMQRASAHTEHLMSLQPAWPSRSLLGIEAERHALVVFTVNSISW